MHLRVSTVTSRCFKIVQTRKISKTIQLLWLAVRKRLDQIYSQLYWFLLKFVMA